ncbi:DEK domain-containing chromatin-associated protein 2-like [Syzygium oleosum]|uniref:DEK domain-containing chromatin-associated protein 2-like n=1 Tax=Syzygium oleosum TaxID=219896 RepID=UPI0024B8AFC4|nr:DEK domain-containing chromatin-associated protein 2-like [Syzygium oleosum]
MACWGSSELGEVRARRLLGQLGGGGRSNGGRDGGAQWLGRLGAAAGGSGSSPVEGKEELPEKSEVEEADQEDREIAAPAEASDEEASAEDDDGDDARKEKESEENPKGGSSVEKQGVPKRRRKSSAAKKDSVTPGIERPTRERTLVELYSAPALVRTPSSKGFSIEKGRGIQLKDIPNGMFPALIVSSWFTVG